MTYPTHRKLGEIFAVLFIPVAFMLGIFPEVVDYNESVSEFLFSVIFLAVLWGLSLRSSLFGAGWNDLDMSGTEPDRKYPILGALMRMFGVKHRGKFSHSLDSITIFYLSFWFIIQLIRNKIYMDWENHVGFFEGKETFLTTLVISVIAILVFRKTNLRKFKIVRSIISEKELKTYKICSLIVLIVLLYITLSYKISNGDFREIFMSSEGVIFYITSVWVFFAWVGSLSHLFGDAWTKSGVRIFFFLPPIRFVPNMRYFRTGEDWEAFYYKSLRILYPVAIIATLYIMLK